MSFPSYAHVSRCARHALEPTDHRLMYADDIMICAVSPHSVVAIRSALFNAPWFFYLGATTTEDWTRWTCCSALLADRCCGDIKHAIRHRAECLNTYCKNMPFSMKMICVQLSAFNSDTYWRTPSPAHNSQTTRLRVHVPSQKMILSAWPIIPIILSVSSCYTLYIFLFPNTRIA